MIAGSSYEDIKIERRVDTVILRQEDNVIELDAWFVSDLIKELVDYLS